MKPKNPAALQARMDAASSINWPERTPFLMNPDPAIRKRFARGVLIVGLALAAFAIINDPSGPLASWARSKDNGDLRPAMILAMNNGNRAAGTWLAVHYARAYPGLLEQEASAGEPTAMFILGSLLVSDQPDRYVHVDESKTKQQIKDQGMSLIRSAANAGNMDAVVYLCKHGNV